MTGNSSNSNLLSKTEMRILKTHRFFQEPKKPKEKEKENEKENEKEKEKEKEKENEKKKEKEKKNENEKKAAGKPRMCVFSFPGQEKPGSASQAGSLAR